jgi:3-hydroxyacyl-[acyl-carrier-protein] dehydratase
MKGSMSREAEDLLDLAAKTPLLPGFDGSQPPLFRREEVERVMTHRDPFLFIDDVLTLDLEKGLIATRYDLERGRFILAGHYPGDPFWPAVFQIEAVAQSGGFLFNSKHKVPGAPGLLTHVLGGRFMLPVKPGSDLHIVSRTLEDGLMIEVVGQCLQNGQICSAAAVKFYSLSEDWE